MKRQLVMVVALFAWMAFRVQAAQAQLLSAHTTVTTTPGIWSYTVFNDEPAGSPNFISTFDLAVNAPVAVTGSPDGWDYTTDGSTFVQWFNTDAALPYPHDVAPGASLDGFVLQSPGTISVPSAYDLAAWDHSLDAPGTTMSASVLAPSVVLLAVPEPHTGMWCSALVVLLGAFFTSGERRRRFNGGRYSGKHQSR